MSLPLSHDYSISTQETCQLITVTKALLYVLKNSPQCSLAPLKVIADTNSGLAPAGGTVRPPSATEPCSAARLTQLGASAGAHVCIGVCGCSQVCVIVGSCAVCVCCCVPARATHPPRTVAYLPRRCRSRRGRPCPWWRVATEQSGGEELEKTLTR